MFYLTALACAALLLPLLALFARSLPLRTYTSVWATARDEIVTGLLVAGASATLLTTLAFALAYATRESRLRGFVRYAALFAFVIPGPLLALGMIAQWNRPGLPGAVYDSAAILVFACVARFFALGDAAFRAQQARLNPRLIEAASVAGVRWWRVLLGIELPLSLPYLLGVWVIAFVLSLGEVDSAVLLSPPGIGTFAVRLFSLMHYGPDSFVAALSLTTAVGVGVLGLCGVIGFRALSRRFNAGA
jgi:iron(III) transport system permease protein